MQVRAISIGHAVPGNDFDAVVHSVFDSALNLKPDGSDLLITLVTFDAPDLPQGIRLEESSEFAFRAVTPGMQARCRDGMLRFEGAPLTIDLHQAAGWDRELPIPRADLIKPSVAAAWQCGWVLLNNRQALDTSGLIARDFFGVAEDRPAWVLRAGECMRLLVDQTRRHGAATETGLRGLIGLGPGLTPSGDDLLGGYLIGLRSAAQGEGERLAFVSRLADAVTQRSAQTNDISRTYLVHAAQGHASSRLLDLASSICSGASVEQTTLHTEAAMQLGHTSGMDAVSGLLIGMAAWDAPHLLRAAGAT
jgi:hypothetical protein